MIRQQADHPSPQALGSADPSGRPPGTARDRARGSLAARAPGIKADQIGQRAALIEQDEALGRDGGGLGPPSLPRLGDLGLVLLRGAQAFLFFA